ncbi:hypothetical protein [Coleofasciculus chthonoplastes]|uniref:hypothetical protein n=1 Tax=Coleofasciculus chthonoplastes TaxID=64178 RepID=UPI0032F3319D
MARLYSHGASGTMVTKVLIDVSTAITPDSRADIAKIGTLKALTLILQCYP